MIRSFAKTPTKTERVWNGLHSRRLAVDLESRALDKLKVLNRAKTFDDLRNPPSNQLHALKEERAG